MIGACESIELSAWRLLGEAFSDAGRALSGGLAAKSSEYGWSSGSRASDK
jgi:hypothetical protein